MRSASAHREISQSAFPVSAVGAICNS